MEDTMKGYKTLLFNAGLAVVVALLTWGTSVDWSTVVSPTFALIIVAGANAALRLVTNTAVGQST